MGYREVVPDLEGWDRGKGYDFAILGVLEFFHDVMILDFKFGSNRTAGSEDTIDYILSRRTDDDRTIRLPCFRR